MAYRSLALDFELWSYAQLPVVAVYLQHFEHLLSTSKHVRYNVLRTFQKSAMVRKMLYALRSGFFEPTAVPMVVGQSAVLAVPVLCAESREPAGLTGL